MKDPKTKFEVFKQLKQEGIFEKGDTMKILITGATGYIGVHYVKVAAEHGHEVVLLILILNKIT